ncbi:MAG: hypothetical protein I8H71_00255 [Xanthomonadaceae bacterium]|nr:hypothetical protein [Xanthomonadaceae bacterium]MBH2008104.1 hypothetical protein [Xanthomonadaceae bacterium]
MKTNTNRNGLKLPRRPRWPANPLAHESTAHKVRTFSVEEAAELSVEVHLAWEHLINGRGTFAYFDTVANALNASLILSERIGQDAVDMAQRAQCAMVEMQKRYHRVGSFSADAVALTDVPPGLDLFDQLMGFSNPLQLVQAVGKSWQRIKQGHVLAPAHPGTDRRQA